MSEATQAGQGFRRDDRGRPVGEDGWPISGLATISEVVAASGLSRSKVYLMLDREIPTRLYGRSRRVEWGVVRNLFLTSKVETDAGVDDPVAS